jgi:hypothetical protein
VSKQVCLTILAGNVTTNIGRFTPELKTASLLKDRYGEL